MEILSSFAIHDCSLEGFPFLIPVLVFFPVYPLYHSFCRARRHPQSNPPNSKQPLESSRQPTPATLTVHLFTPVFTGAFQYAFTRVHRITVDHSPPCAVTPRLSSVLSDPRGQPPSPYHCQNNPTPSPTLLWAPAIYNRNSHPAPTTPISKPNNRDVRLTAERIHNLALALPGNRYRRANPCNAPLYIWIP